MRKETLVYDVSRWDGYQHGQFVSRCNDAQETIRQGKEKIFSFPRFQEEAFSRLYNPNPQKVEKPKPEALWAQRAHDELENIPDFERLRSRCQGDRFFSGVASTSFSAEYLERLPEPPKETDPQELRDKIKSLKDLAEKMLDEQGKIPGELSQQINEIMQNGKDSVKNYLDWGQEPDGSQIREALRAGIAAANQDVDNAEEQMSALGCGKGPGSRQKTSIETKVALYERIKNNPKLQKIAKEAGRLQRIARQKQRTRSKKARSEVQGIEMGCDVGRLLPSELSKLANEERFDEFAKDFSEKRLLQYKLEGKERQSQGPIVCCIDNSGSMIGEPEIWSKAVALALLETALDQKRDFSILHFNSVVEENHYFQAGQVNLEDLLDALENFWGGGTDYQPVLLEALHNIEKGGLSDADLVFITDDECSIAPNFVRAFKMKKENLGFVSYGIMIGARESKTLDLFCDSVIGLQDLTDESEAHQIFETI